MQNPRENKADQWMPGAEVGVGSGILWDVGFVPHPMYGGSYKNPYVCEDAWNCKDCTPKKV